MFTGPDLLAIYSDQIEVILQDIDRDVNGQMQQETFITVEGALLRSVTF